MRVLVTGCAAHLGRALLPRLWREPDIEVVGVDLRPSGLQHPRYAEHILDVREAALGGLLAGCDALVHLAFVVMPGDFGRRRFDRGWIREMNVTGTRHVFEAAARHGLTRAVHLSSAAVYGAWPDNPRRITEEHPLRPNTGFHYGEDKAEVERWLDAFAARQPRPKVARLRCHAVLGPHAQPLLRFLMRQPLYPLLPDPQPLTQCVWEDDVAEAVLAALRRDVEGAFNIAAEPALAFRDLIRGAHRLSLPIPCRIIDSVQRGLWPLTGRAGPPGWVSGLRHSLALDCTRAHRLLEWHPRLSVHECVQRVRSAP